MPDLSTVRPVRRVYLGLTADPYDALSTVVWTEIEEISGRQMESVTLRWGAQHELARVEPSYAAVTFDNRLGHFEALNSSSPYYPNLRPLNRLRIVDSYAGVDYIRFTGYVSDWPRSWNGYNQASVTVEAWDALGAVLNAVVLPTWDWELQVRKLIEQVPSTGKAVWLRLNETSGTLAADSSGYNLNGQYQGSPTLGQDGLTPDGDKAVRFISNTRASLPYKDLITGYPFTFTCWFKCDPDVSGAKMFFSAFDGASAPFNRYVQAYIAPTGVDAGKIISNVRNPAPSGAIVTSTITVNAGGYHHLAIVYETSTSFKIYIDGVDRTSMGAATALPFPTDLVTGYAIGNYPANAYGDFRFGFTANDILDEVLILDGLALTAAEVDDLYEAGVAVPTLLATSGIRVLHVLEAIGWPSADTDIDAGKSTILTSYVAGTLPAYLQRVDVTEGGRLFVNGEGVIVFQDRHAVLQAPYTVSQATFGEGAGEIGYDPPFTHGEDDADIHNDVRIGNVGGTVQVARDATSKARYGWKTLSLTDLLGTSDEEAKDRANRDLALYKDPTTRIRQIVVKPQHEDPALAWPALLGLGQNSRVTVKAQPPGSPLLTQQSHVERMEETVTPLDWSITLGLSSAQAGEFWVLGTSALDTGTRLAY